MLKLSNCAKSIRKLSAFSLLAISRPGVGSIKSREFVTDVNHHIHYDANFHCQ